MSKAAEVAGAIKAAVEGLGWTAGDPPAAVPVVCRKTPSLPPGKEPPQVVIVIGEEGDSEYLSAARDLITYPAAVVYFSAGGKKLADDTEVRDRREAVRKKMEAAATFAGVAGFNRVLAGGKAPFDPGALAKDLNASYQVFRVEVIEART